MANPSGTSTVVALLVLGVFAIVAVVLRFWARAMQRVSLQLNDFLILPALVGTEPFSLSRLAYHQARFLQARIVASYYTVGHPNATGCA